MRKRTLSILLAMCLVLAMLPTMGLAEEEGEDIEEFDLEEVRENVGAMQSEEDLGEQEDILLVCSFPDVPEFADYGPAVAYLESMRIITGDENGNFNPNSAITRAEAATIICRLMEVEDEAKSTKRKVYDDVDVTYWAAGYIAKATELGVFNGDGTGKFHPTDNVTYEQFIKILVCATGYEIQAQRNGGWPNGYIVVAENLGITDGIRFIQTANAPRSAVAQLIYNSLI